MTLVLKEEKLQESSGRGVYLHPGWEQHSKHSVAKTDGGSPWGSRPSHCAQRRDWSQSLLCSDYRRSALDAMLALEHGSPGGGNEAWCESPVGCSRACGLHIVVGTLHTVF